MVKFFSKYYLGITRIFLISLFINLLLICRPVCVQGYSMYPTLEPGTTLFLNTLDKTPKIGDIVVVEPLICFGGKTVIKRVVDVRDGEIFLEGDNKEISYDSRNVGWIKTEHILGVIIQ